jgi:hypothetical protein
VIVVVLAMAVIATAGIAWLEDRRGDPPTGSAVAAEGDPANPAEPACGPVLRAYAGDAGDHIDNAPIAYSSAPPSFGDHRSRWEVRAASFYDVDARPEVEVLVHNLEHGYNILWYDQSVVDDSDALARVREIADGYATLGRVRDPATAFIAAPWTADDGDGFPAGMNYALTHWYADPTDPTRSRADEVGLTRYCAGISAEIVQDWMDDYPLTDAPEGYPDLM